MLGFLFVWEAVCFVMILLPKGDSTGVFEVQLTSLINGWGLTYDGLCCTSAHGDSASPHHTLNYHHYDDDDDGADEEEEEDITNVQYSGGDTDDDDISKENDDEEEEEEEEECEEECRTFIRVCLSHHQQPLPSGAALTSKSGCTFGNAVSDVLGGNTLDPFGTWRERVTGGTVNPNTLLSIPFTFSWPEKYTLVVEAWHDHDGYRSTQDRRHLIARAVQGGRLQPSALWQNHSTSSGDIADLAFRFRVRCDPNYYGSGCDLLCRDANDSIVGHYTCDVNGARVCLSGWKGDFCDKAECFAECEAGDHGFCEQPYECRCRLGWRGSLCSQCQTYSGCLHGYCNTAWECLCQQGWSGSLCNIDNFYCERYTPCHNGGTCTYDAVKNFTCSCPLGYGGDRCQYPVCYPGYCQNHGLCTTTAEGLLCRCRGGFQGERCQHVLETCGSLSCGNNGTCVRQGSQLRCLCRPGFTGPRCELEGDECLSAPCQHGGTCVDRLNGYHCQCAPGYAGRNCDLALDPCVAFKCFNHGTCMTQSSAYLPTCLCRHEFTGQRCETPLDPCVGIACLNGGSCLRTGTASFHCACAHGYSGRVCQIPPPGVLCEDQPCLNGGTCRRTQNGVMMCACLPGFRGALCESPATVVTTTTTTTTATTMTLSPTMTVTDQATTTTTTTAANVLDSGGGGKKGGGGEDIPRHYRVPYESGAETSHIYVLTILLSVLNGFLFTQLWCVAA
ncbi:uncharacterized protein LOC143299039 [Babylonia areolata]|uniref:uncharacterized protein LOC143299039 n=1 Tax=Babylonia areolata TaxID=304850 RepID=UPI003FD19925